MFTIMQMMLTGLLLGLALTPSLVSAQNSAVGLRDALELAKSQAASADGLDAAYELIGIAEEAKRGDNADIEGEALSEFAAVVNRSTAKASTAAFVDGQDTLDQLIDLVFFARTKNIGAAEQVLQTAAKTLLPRLLGNARDTLADAKEWADQVALIGAIGELQAAAARVMLTQEAGAIGLAFDSEITARERESAGQSSRLEALADVRRVRDEQLADATANNVDAVAEEMRGALPTNDEGEIGEAMSTDLSIGDTSCIETGLLAPEGSPAGWQAPALMLKRLGDECVLSGREPSAERCQPKNLAFVCHAPGSESERITYVYRDTPEETYMRRACDGAVIEAGKLPPTGPQFLNSGSRLVFTCGPSGNEVSSAAP